MVGAKGFEPSTSWSRTRRASQAALRPDSHAPSDLRPERKQQLITALRGIHNAKITILRAYPNKQTRKGFAARAQTYSPVDGRVLTKNKTAGKLASPGGLLPNLVSVRTRSAMRTASSVDW